MKITVIGAAGTLGSCAAFNIVTHKLADKLVILDPWANMLRAHQADLSTAVTGQDITLYTGNDADMKGSDIVLMTAGAPSGKIASRNELLPGNLPIMRENAAKINKYCPEAIVITATNPVDPLNYAMYLLSQNRDRRRFIGYSLNDTYRFRTMAAKALGVATSRVTGYVIGEHDASQVALFSSLRLDGRPVKVDDAFRDNIKQQVAATLDMLESLDPKRTTGWTSARGMEAIIRGITGYHGAVIPCSTVLDGEYGCRNLSMSVPVMLGREGIRGIQEMEMTPDEAERLKNSINTVTPHMRRVEEILGLSAG